MLEDNDVDSVILSRDLRQAASQYRDLVAGRHDDPNISELLVDVQDLGAKALLPAIMSAVDAAGNLNALSELLRKLVTLFVGHNVIGKFENSRLETVVCWMAQRLRDDQDFDAAGQAIQEALLPLDRFEAQFASASVSRQKSARYLLRSLEGHLRDTEEIEVAPPHRVHVEHIFPQRPPDRARWPGHSQWVHRIGNLNLVSRRLNQQLQNATFDVKRNVFQQSELLQTRELAELEGWDTRAIDRRQQLMATRAREIWNCRKRRDCR